MDSFWIAFGALGQVAAAVVIALTLRAMYSQLNVAKVGNQGQIYFQLFHLLTSMREARGLIFSRIDNLKGENEWWDGLLERSRNEPLWAGLANAVELVAGGYNVAGILIQEELVNRDLVVREWGPGADRIFRAIESLISRERTVRREPELWSGFDVLVLE